MRVALARCRSRNSYAPCGDGKYELVGSVDPDPNLPNRARSFSVSWTCPDTTNERRSVSSYTGQYHRFDPEGDEVINTVFLLVHERGPRNSMLRHSSGSSLTEDGLDWLLRSR